jgi:hypothetical protein
MPVYAPLDSMIMFNLLLLFLTKITCFVLGYLTIRMGRDLLREGVKGEFNFGGTAGGASATLASASPGLLFLTLGIVLIGYAMAVTRVIPYEASIQHESNPEPPKVSLPNEKSGATASPTPVSKSGVHP